MYIFWQHLITKPLVLNGGERWRRESTRWQNFGSPPFSWLKEIFTELTKLTSFLGQKQT